MPKSQPIFPEQAFKPDIIKFSDIPVCQYSKSLDEEKQIYTKDDFLRIYHDMRTIREFEHMLNEVKTKGAYNGIEYNNPGPAHLSIGQEASAVGQAYPLDINDLSFGSHRSHGEIIARGLVAIHKLGEDDLYNIMKNFLGGEVLSVVDKYMPAADNVKALAQNFLLYGALAEIFARSTGFNRGLGGSMHCFFIPFGLMPNNAIVGGSGPIALGGALYKRSNDKPGIVIANIGDGALGRGSVLEAMNFASMDQFTKLWGMDGKYSDAGLPILFNIFNNIYGMGGQTWGETMGFGYAARLGAGFTPTQMHAERVNGYDPLAVIDAVSRKKELLLEGKGPALLDVVTYRVSGHSPSDSSTYRTQEEIDAWIDADPIKAFREKLVNGGIATVDEFEAMDEAIVRRTTEVMKLAINDEISPRMDLDKDPDAIAKLMFSNENKPSMDTTREPQMLMPKDEVPRVKEIKNKVRTSVDKDGKPVSKMRLYNIRDGLFEPIIDKLYEDPTLIIYGEDNRDWGGAFGVYKKMTEAVPYHRFFNAPISEAAIVGSAVGYAMCGGRVIVELMYADFMGCAGDEIFNQMAKWQAMSAGILKMPVVLRVSVGSKYGAQHSQDWTALAAHIPGLKVVFPATPADAKGLMTAALNGTDPVIFFESQRIYDKGEDFLPGGVPEGHYEVKIGEPDIKRPGKDITILTIGAVLYRALEAADILEKKYNLSAEIIDARSIVPFDYTKVIESVKKTGRILIVGDACERNSVMKDMAANIAELAFDYLDAPPVALGSRNWITPAHELEEYFFPYPDAIIDCIHEKILPLDGHVPTHDMGDIAKIERMRRGV
ncbi:MAG: alpha-ketoacid dehydrogenase subunit alpha/beta [Eubacteriales bacterium]|jgi:2-oxoisovalerate dehydrogenase E1 component